jgi:hypothetical protein
MTICSPPATGLQQGLLKTYSSWIVGILSSCQVEQRRLNKRGDWSILLYKVGLCLPRLFAQAQFFLFKHNCLVCLPGLLLLSLLVKMGACLSCRFSCTPNPPTQYYSPDSFVYWYELATKASSTKDQYLKNNLPPYIYSTPASSPPLYFALNTQIPIVGELRDLSCEQGPVITETHSRVVIINNTGSRILIQGITVQGDVYFIPGGIWTWTSSVYNNIIGRGNI